MTDYISREAVLERIDGIWDCADMVFEPNDKCCRTDDCASCKWRETKNAIRKIVAYIPAADVRPVVRGVWCPQPSDFEDCTVFVCSNCGYMILISNDREELPYCGNCGADMRGEQT